MKIFIKLMKFYIVIMLIVFVPYYKFWDSLCWYYSDEKIYDHIESMEESSKCVNTFVCKISETEVTYSNNVLNSWTCEKKDLLQIEKLYNLYYGKN